MCEYFDIQFSTTPAAQSAYAIAGSGFPVVEDGELSDGLRFFGPFKGGNVNAFVLSEYKAAERMMDRAPWR